MRELPATRNRFCQGLPGRSLKTHNGIKSIDHPVIAVTDFDSARITYERLGFTDLSQLIFDVAERRLVGGS